MNKLTHPSPRITTGQLDSGRHGFKEIDYEIVDDHYMIYLTQRPSKMSVTSDGRLLHDGPVFPGMMRLASPGEQVHLGIFAHTQTFTVAVPGRVMRDSLRTLINTPRPGAISRLDLLSKPDLQVAQLGRMLRSYEPFDPAHEALFLHGITETLVAYLLRNHGRSVREPIRSAGLTPQEIQHAMQYADANMNRVITLDDWAAELRMPVNEFRRRFRLTVGCSPYAWYMQRRVDRAKDLLADAKEPLCQIALSVGFSSQSHFTEAFRQREGMPPARWREQQG